MTEKMLKVKELKKGLIFLLNQELWLKVNEDEFTDRPGQVWCRRVTERSENGSHEFYSPGPGIEFADFLDGELEVTVFLT